MFRNFCPGCVGISADFETSLDLTVRNGFEGMDPVGDLTAPGAAAAMRGRYEGAGIQAGGWGLPVEFRRDDAAFRDGMQQLPRVAAAARELGCLRCPTWVPSWCDELSYAEQYVLWRDRFRAIAQVLGEYDCRLGLEFLGPKTLRAGHRYEFIHTLPQMMEMVRDVGANAGLLLDSWHWYTAGGTLDEIRELSDADIVYVHINDAPAGIGIDEQIDSVRALPGETGVIDLAGFLGALRDIGYTGPVTVEPFSARVNAMAPEDAARETGESLMDVWRQAGL
ncbi:MAG: sugar phosphate isomerase/epimerase [Armatimonadota bacterium]|nr:MAG: sugar phosphate isomerase/epimerase [Armatimonadota bacterium]